MTNHHCFCTWWCKFSCRILNKVFEIIVAKLPLKLHPVTSVKGNSFNWHSFFGVHNKVIVHLYSPFGPEPGHSKHELFSVQQLPPPTSTKLSWSGIIKKINSICMISFGTVRVIKSKGRQWLSNDPGKKGSNFFCYGAISFPHIGMFSCLHRECVNLQKGSLQNRIYLNFVFWC